MLYICLPKCVRKCSTSQDIHMISEVNIIRGLKPIFLGLILYQNETNYIPFCYLIGLKPNTFVNVHSFPTHIGKAIANNDHEIIDAQP